MLQVSTRLTLLFFEFMMGRKRESGVCFLIFFSGAMTFPEQGGRSQEIPCLIARFNDPSMHQETPHCPEQVHFTGEKCEFS